jgi:hypothetical protein
VLTSDIARTILDYCPDSGVMHWRLRSVDFSIDGKNSAASQQAAWNGRFAGKVAGYIDKQGYWSLHIFHRRYRAPRVAWLIMTGEWPAGDIDHINLNRSDDRWSNLRVATESENMANRLAPRNNTSGFKGVSFDRKTKKWRAKITKNYSHHYLGAFDTPEAACAAYSKAAHELFGEFARTDVLRDMTRIHARGTP